MSRIIPSKKRDLNIKDYRLRTASDKDFATLVTEPVTIMDGEKVKVVYDKIPFDVEKYREAVLNVKYIKGKRTSGLTSISRIFGYSPRNELRRDFCSTASMAEEQPEEHALICELGQRIAAHYLKMAPEVYGTHKELAQENMRTEWMIPGTPFTSGIINKNNPLKYHFDTGNFKQVFSCMVSFRKGIKGGHLSLPEYDMGLEIADGHVLLFDGQEILHGVTPFEVVEDDGYRYTIVFYSLKRMWECLTVDDEIARIRNIKTNRERKRLASIKTDHEPEHDTVHQGGERADVPSAA